MNDETPLNLPTIPSESEDSRDLVFGSQKSIFHRTHDPTLLYSGNWTNHLPTEETQKKRFDTYGCVTWSATNILEILMIFHRFKKNILKRLRMLDKFEKPNIAERPTVVMSGTVKRRGNTFRNVANSLRNDGFVGEEVYPFPDDMTEDEYYKPVPQNIKDEMLKAKKYYKVSYEAVWQKDLEKALRYGPIQVAVDTLYTYKNGIIQAKGKYRYNDGQVLVAKTKEAYILFGSYKPYLRKFSLDYKFGYPKRYHIEEIKLDTDKFLNRYEGKYVMGNPTAIYKIENGKKRPFAKYFDFLLFSEDKGFTKVDPVELELVEMGEFMNVEDAPLWYLVSSKYELLSKLTTPEMQLRIKQLANKNKSGSEWTSKKIEKPKNLLTQLQKLFKAIKNLFLK